MERFVYMEKSKAEREGPEKRAQRLMATVADTVETLAVLPSRRYGVAEWLMTHRLLLSHPPPRLLTPATTTTTSAASTPSSLSSSPSSIPSTPPSLTPSPTVGASSASSSSGSTATSTASVAASSSGGAEGAVSQPSLQAVLGEEGELVLDELVALAGRFNLLVKAFRDSPLFGQHAFNPRRRRVLQQLNNHLHHRYVNLLHLLADPDATLPSLHLGLLHDPAVRAFWQAATPHFMLGWAEFLQQWELQFPAWPPAYSQQLQEVLDFSGSGFVSAYQFGQFVQGFGPFADLPTNFVEVVKQPWFHGYISFQDTVRLLSQEPVGTFLIRQREMLPGTFALCFVMPRNKVFQIPITPNEPHGFKLKDDNDQYVEFKQLEEIVGAYQQLLRVPFSSSVNREPWFFGDLSGAETVGLLTGLPPGTFLVRFSAQHAHCLSAAYVDPSGDITHALITKSSLGYHHGDDDVFPTLHALLAAYQAVLVHPCVEPDLVQQLCEEVRTQARIFKAAEDAADSRDDADDGEVVEGKKKMPHKVFGESLVDTMRNNTKYPIPYVAEQCILYLNQHIKLPQLFLTPATQSEVDQLKELFNKGRDVDLFLCTNPHLIAALLLEYLRELPEPLLCADGLFQGFMGVPKLPEEQQAPELAGLVAKLPEEHVQVLRYLFQLFQRLARPELAKDNAFDAEEVSNVVGPCILRDPNANGRPPSKREAKHIVLLTKMIIAAPHTFIPRLDTVSLDWVEGDGIVLTPNRRQVKSGTKEKLVETLYSPGELNSSSVPAYVPKFMLTYRSFMTGKELLTILMRKFEELQEKGDDDSRKKILRICNFLKQWSEECYYEFQADEELMNEYKNFVGSILEKNLLSFMLSSIDKLHQPKSKTLVFTTPAPRSLWNKNKGPITKVLHIKALEVARQMTLIDFDLYCKIRPRELCEGAWTKEDRYTTAPNIMNLVHRFNLVVRWIVTQIVQAKNSSKREAIIAKWIDVANYFRELNNFNGVNEVLAAMGSAAVLRLESFKKKENHPVLRELREMLQPTGNYKAFRKVLKQANPPLVPFVGCFQTDLVFIEDGNKILLPNGHTHFAKCYKVAAVIQQIQQYQQTPYNLAVVPAIRDFLLNINPLTEEECWNLSLALKPLGT